MSSLLSCVDIGAVSTFQRMVYGCAAPIFSLKTHFWELPAPFPGLFPNPCLGHNWSVREVFGSFEPSKWSSLLYCVDIGVSLAL